jgi:ABC-2 type transport system ATP-binding protein
MNARVSASHAAHRQTTGVDAREPVVSVAGLNKSFAGRLALDALDLTLYPGDIVGLLGPNGAGKTTTLKVLLGLLKPSAGTANVFGYDCVVDHMQIKERVGFMADEPQFYDFLTGRETLDFVVDVRGLDHMAAWTALERTVDLLEMTPYLDAPVASYSLGTKKKLAMLCAFVHQPRVLLLDEPTNGLDPPATRRVRALLHGVASEGAAVLVCTHQLEMADRLCNKVIILNCGRSIASGTSAEIRAQAGVGRHASLEDAFFALVGT